MDQNFEINVKSEVSGSDDSMSDSDDQNEEPSPANFLQVLIKVENETEGEEKETTEQGIRKEESRSDYQEKLNEQRNVQEPSFNINEFFNPHDTISSNICGKRRILSLEEKIEIIEAYSTEKISVRDLSKRFNIGKTQAAKIIQNKINILSAQMSNKRRVLSLKEKIEIVEVYNREKLSVRDLSKRFNIGKTQAAGIVKHRSELLTQWHSNINKDVKRNFLNPVGSTIDKFCYDWFLKAKNEGVMLSGPLIRAKAKEIAENMGLENFSASSGWLHKFRNRHNIAFKAENLNQEEIERFLMKATSIMEKYSPSEIYNADRTGLFFRALPDKSSTLKNEKCIDGKLSNERLTILHCVNMAGEKEKLLVIGKPTKSIKNINTDTLPVVWRSDKKAWLTSEIMREWLENFDRKMAEEGRRVLLFLDNPFSLAKNLQLANVLLVFLPANCASIVQPLNQGIIRNFKIFYRTNLLRNILLQMDSIGSIQGLSNSTTVLDAIYFIKYAWQKVSPETIQYGFQKAGIVHEDTEITVENDDEFPLLSEMQQNFELMGFNDHDLDEFINIDNNLVLDCHSSVDISEDSDEEEEIGEQTNATNYQQAIGMIKNLEEFSRTKGDSRAMEMLSDLKIHFLDSIFNT